MCRRRRIRPARDLNGIGFGHLRLFPRRVGGRVQCLCLGFEHAACSLLQLGLASPAGTLTGTCAAPGTGFEPVTLRLTAACSTAELTRTDGRMIPRPPRAFPQDARPSLVVNDLPQRCLAVYSR